MSFKDNALQIWDAICQCIFHTPSSIYVMNPYYYIIRYKPYLNILQLHHIRPIGPRQVETPDGRSQELTYLKHGVEQHYCEH